MTIHQTTFLMIVIVGGITATIAVNNVNGKLDHKTFEKCFKETVPSYIRDALDEKTKLAIENESINYNNSEPNSNDTLAVEAHKLPTEIHSCMLGFG